MVKLHKCCCCFGLKRGFFAYGTICLVFRICATTSLYFIHLHYVQDIVMSLLFGFTFGWCLSTATALYLALKGLAMKKSVLMYPYIIILVVEIFILSAFGGLLVINKFELFIIMIYSGLLVFNMIINIYAALCLISLYKHTRAGEKLLLFDETPMKTL